MKMLMREMPNSENTKHSGPSVVARLMGMDTLPPVTGTTIHVKECSNESPRQYISRTAHCESIKGPRNALPSTTFKQSADKLPLNWKQQYSRLSIKNPNSVKPFLREHPQEEQLQKFKKEFEAWQESKLWEFSSIFDQNNSSGGLKNKQILALKTFNNEKMAGFTDLHTSVNKLKFSPNQHHGFRHDNSFGKQFMPQTKDDMAIKRELANKSIEPASRAKFHEKKSGPCSPSRIVILKSFSDMNDEMEGPSGRLPKVLEKGNGIEDLLEEVKKRLKLELEGKGKNDSIRRLTAAHISSPPHETLTDSKQLTREVAKPIKENTTSDLEATLRRSEIMRSCSNRFHFDRQDFPEFINAETRNLVTERLKNVLKDDTELEKLMLDDVRGEEFLQTKEKSRSKSCISLSKVGIGTSFWDPKNSVNESFSKHFRHEEVKKEAVVAEVMSPPNFVRSFSAPVSRSSFGKALLKDHHATKAQNFQLHEASKNDSAVNKSKKDGFGIKDKVSNLKRTFGLKAKLFRKKVSSIPESTEDTAYNLKPNQSMPLVLRNFGVVQDNFTEVPPTPVSFLCTPMSEHHSPVSPLEVPFVEDYLSTQVSGELIMTRPESKSLTENVEGRRYGVETAAEPYDSNEMALLEDDGEAYVRDVLLLSGLFRAWPLDQVISNLDGQIKPIPSLVFDDLEKRNCINLARSLDDDFSAVNLGNIIVDRKLLFDLVNEALPSVIDAPMNRLVSGRRAHSSTQLPTGRRLLGELLHQIQIYSNPVIDLPQSVERVVACDVKLMPLCSTSREDIGSIGREVESAIIEDLIDGLINVLLV